MGEKNFAKKKYIPFTVDDWREFENLEFYEKNPEGDILKIRVWSESEVWAFFGDSSCGEGITYTELCNDYCLVGMEEIPCGREVK